MRTNPTNYYELLSFGLGDSKFAWQQFVDKFQSKYNETQTDGFAWDAQIQLDYTYEQLIANLNIATLPVYVDAESEALDKARGEWKVGSNKIPTQKHRYGLNAHMLREQMLMVQKFGNAALNSAAKSAIMNMLFDSTDKLLAGNRNALTHQRMQIVSNGKFTINAANNPRGIQGITFDFGIKAEPALTNTARWWTNATHSKANEGAAADPIEDMKSKVKEYRHKGYPSMQVEMSQELFDDLLGHSKVLSRIGAALYPNANDPEAYAKNLADDALKTQLERLVGCPIKVYDSKAMAEKFDTATSSLSVVPVENFNPKNIAFVPQGQIGTIKAVQPIVFADDPTARYAWFDGGRTLISQRFDSKTRATYIESEMATLLVPNMPQYMSVMTVTV